MRPHDFGPLYAETVFGRLPVEPWNTYSNVVFLITLVYFARETRLDLRRHPLIVSGLPILAIGFIGGTLYHATRNSSIWLIMDFLPISILSILAAIYYWFAVLQHKALATVALAVTFGAGHLIRRTVSLPHHLSISFGYTLLALGIILPVLLHCRQRGWKDLSLIVGSLLSFTIAISFRVLDSQLAHHIPMGTHFLWHIFGGMSTFLVLLYTYRSDLERSGYTELSRLASTASE